MRYQIVIEKMAAKELKKLPKNIRQRIDEAIDFLREDPFAGKKLDRDFAGAWSLRVWPYRIIYTIDQKIVTVTVLRVGHRQGVYK